MTLKEGRGGGFPQNLPLEIKFQTAAFGAIFASFEFF